MYFITSPDVMRNALPSTSKLKWDYLRDYDGKYAIPYVITGKYEKKEKRAIYDAMQLIDENTCIRFRLRSAQSDYVDIQNVQGEGCYSTVGRYGGQSILMLEASKLGSCMQVGTIVHELLHIIGLWHEHMREDRDKYVKIHTENIQKGYENQFAKLLTPDAVTHNVPYDYLSIMHYEGNAFANPRTITIEALDSKYQNKMGKQQKPSKNDYKKVCRIYNCITCMGAKMEQIPSTPTASASTKPKRTLPPNYTLGCDDKDLLKCYRLYTSGKLNCLSNEHMEFCCGMCNSLSESGHTVPLKPLTRATRLLPYKTLPSGVTRPYKCQDKESTKTCEELSRYGQLKCREERHMRRCCGTCNAMIDFYKEQGSEMP
ncbi:astacin [Oesophagostomum dentatum]|uniref:Metalloendopeptidase n=1 Tax=Oesophagostomum dentatum TaxID=61180 RepID=A0A0B1TDV2_OESDE|nr:astacin [Oesophagostomum dentatum]